MRFSDRVDNYIKYRPHYPEAILDYLKQENILKPGSVIADIGSGTGISSELFLKKKNIVYGVEPNKEMREAAERLLSEYQNFISIDGSAEETKLDNSSVDIVTAGQAFHWFDLNNAKKEFRRILKSNGYVVLMWNIRITEDSEFMRRYEKLLNDYGTDYKEVKCGNMKEEDMQRFFEGRYKIKKFKNADSFDLEGLKGRILSASYAPAEAEQGYKEMIKEIEKMFEEFKKNGKVTINYICEVYTGRV